MDIGGSDLRRHSAAHIAHSEAQQSRKGLSNFIHKVNLSYLGGGEGTSPSPMTKAFLEVRLEKSLEERKGISWLEKKGGGHFRLKEQLPQSPRGVDHHGGLGASSGCGKV